MNKRWIKPTIGLVLGAGLLVLIISRATEQNKTGAAASKTAPSSTLVQIEIVTNQALERGISVTGSLSPNEQVDLKAEISGRVASVDYDDGQMVRQGQILARLVVRDLEAQLRKLNFSKQLATTFEQRQKQLLDKEAISQQEYDQALTSVNTLEADIANLEAQIEKATIRAPFNGKVGTRLISVGSYLNPGTMITSLVSQDPIKVDFAVPARYASQLAVGANVYFIAEGETQQHQAKVYAIDPVVDMATRTIKLRAKCPNPAGKLLPGAFIAVTYPLQNRLAAITVPTEALTLNAGMAKVWVIRNGMAEPINVKTGQRQTSRIEITDGLNTGDSLITVGVQLLKPGGKVRAITTTSN